MKTDTNPQLTFYLISGETEHFQIILNNFNQVMKQVNGELLFLKNRKKYYLTPIDNKDFKLIESSNLVFAIANFNTDIIYQVGAAHALGKPVIFIKISLPESYNNHLDLPLIYDEELIKSGICIKYEMTSSGTAKFKSDLKSLIEFYVQNPFAFKENFSYYKKDSELDFFIDLEKLEPPEYENLCFELISQMGFQKVDWGLKMKEIDMVAMLPKKDPDGYEYNELWLVATEKNSYSEQLFDRLMFEPEYIFDKMFRSDVFLKNKFKNRSDISITILFILKEDKPGFFKKDLEEMEERFRHRRFPANIRIRVWDPNYLIKLIHGYPQIAYKYFSEESISKSKYRKSPKELNEENLKLTEQLIRTNSSLEEEKRKRFIAERETAWKDVAFKAAHKLGNPIDAADTLLQGLKDKLEEGNIIDAKYRIELIDSEIEKTKNVISQFKSLTKVEEIIQEPSNIKKIIQYSLKTADFNGIKINIVEEANLPPVFVDPVRIEECFSELYNNSLHWFNKPQKIIEILLIKAKLNELPEALEGNKDYVKINFQDNGCGINHENKEKIFSPFFTTYIHGSGLGLPFVKKIIEKQNGWIFENGTPGAGASFVIFLPIAKI